MPSLRRAFAETPATSRDSVEQTIRLLFACDNPELWKLAVDTFQNCVLGRLQPAEPPLRHTWLAPGGVYMAQWIWDTMFVVDLLSYLPGQTDVIRGIFQNYWDFQARWKRVKPSYSHGFIANYIAPDSGPPRLNGKDWLTFPAFSQAPLLAWGMERVFDRNHDLQLVRSGIGPLEGFHDWFWRERDLREQGLICVGAYSGVAEHARYETYDREVDLDGMKMTSHPTRKDAHHDRWYGDICIPANTAYLLQSEASLIRLAEACGDQQMAARRRPFLDKGIAAMRRFMWNQDTGCFLAVNRDSLDQVSTATVGGFVPLMADVPSAAQARRMGVALEGSDWATPLPIPTVARSDKNYSSASFWRGDTWPAPTYQVAAGLARYGQHALASRIADVQIDNALKHGINERYDSQSGTALGVPHLGMSGVVLNMALDGLSSKFKITALRKQHAAGQLMPSARRLNPSSTPDFAKSSNARSVTQMM